MNAARIGRTGLGAEQGLSLVEATIILMVLATLTAVVAPAAGPYIENARNTKAKEDVEVIGSAIDQLLRDTASACVSASPAASMSPASTAPCAIANRVELLVSGAALNTDEPEVATSAYGASTSIASANSLNWAGGSGEVGDANKKLMDAHLVTNTAGYTAAVFTGGGGPRTGIGWRGAYLNGPMDVDPWGHVYQANTIFLAVAHNATNSTGTGELRGGWVSDVMVISAGSNGVVQTAFGATGATAVGDDVVYVLQGGTH
jgi:type II secretory pathway pseudopilin PulG